MTRYLRIPAFGLSKLRLTSSRTVKGQFCVSRHHSSGSNIVSASPYDLVNLMRDNGLRRCYVVFDESTQLPKTSNDTLFGDLKAFLTADHVNYIGHEGVFLEIGRRSGALLGSFVWRTNRGQACGGIRLWKYETLGEYIQDGLRLAYGMGLKSALAGLWAGGGKGVIAAPDNNIIHDPVFRNNMFLDYGDLLSSLNGCYVAAEDAGVVVSDLDHVHSRTRYTTCISEELGGSGNPSIATGKGIVCAMEAAVDFLDMGSIEGKSVVMQGAGNVGRIIIEGLLERNVGHIYVADCNENQLKLTKEMFPGQESRLQLEHVQVNDVQTLHRKCDILSPNALGNILNEETIPGIQAKIVCGAANNQLGKPSDNKLMAKKGITYVVDFLANRMGIVNCANEAYGRLTNDPAITRHFSKDWNNSIWVMTKRVLQTAKDRCITPHEAAVDLAHKLSWEQHPIWPKRSQQIIESLVADKWDSR